MFFTQPFIDMKIEVIHTYFNYLLGFYFDMLVFIALFIAIQHKVENGNKNKR